MSIPQRRIRPSLWPVVGSVAAMVAMVVGLVLQLLESGPITRGDVALISTGVLAVFGWAVIAAFTIAIRVIDRRFRDQREADR